MYDTLNEQYCYSYWLTPAKFDSGLFEKKFFDKPEEISFEEAGEKVLCRCVLAAGNDPLNPLYITRGLQKAGLIPEDGVVTYLRCEILDENGEIFF